MDLVLSAMELIGESEIKVRLSEMIERFRELQLDPEEFTFLKYLVLFNPSKYGKPCCLSHRSPFRLIPFFFVLFQTCRREAAAPSWRSTS